MLSRLYNNIICPVSNPGFPAPSPQMGSNMRMAPKQRANPSIASTPKPNVPQPKHTVFSDENSEEY